MGIRTSRERLIQAVAYEVGGIVAALPVGIWMTGTDATSSALMLVMMTGATMFWGPVFNTAFDQLEWRLCARRASDRSAGMRLVHAAGLEFSDMAVTVPILIAMGGLSLDQALVADLGLTLLWIGYTYLFHLGFDRIRPVQGRPMAQHPSAAGAR